MTLSVRIRKHRRSSGTNVVLRPCTRLVLRVDPGTGALVVATEPIAAGGIGGGPGAGSVRVAPSGTALQTFPLQQFIVQFQDAARNSIGPALPFLSNPQTFPLPDSGATQLAVGWSGVAMTSFCGTFAPVPPPAGFTGYAAVIDATVMGGGVVICQSTIAPANV